MRTFGAIFATLTLALSASAAAIYPRGSVTTDNLGGLAGVVTTVNDVANKVDVVHQDVKNRQLPNLPHLTSAADGVTNGLHVRDDTSFPSLVIGVTNEIVEIAAGLDVAIQGDVDVNAVIVILGKINAALGVCVDAVAKLDLKASTVLFLDGKVQVVAQVAALISVLIHVVVKVIVVVLKIKVLADVSAVVTVCTAICVNVAAIIRVAVVLCPGIIAIIVHLVADIKVDLVATVFVKVFVAICGVLHI